MPPNYLSSETLKAIFDWNHCDLGNNHYDQDEYPDHNSTTSVNEITIKCHRIVVIRLEAIKEQVQANENSAVIIHGVPLKLFLHVLGYAYTDDFMMFYYETIAPVDFSNIDDVPILFVNNTETGAQVALSKCRTYVDVSPEKHHQRIHNISPGRLSDVQLHFPNLFFAAHKLGFEKMVIRSLLYDWPVRNDKQISIHGCADQENCPLAFKNYSQEAFCALVQQVYSIKNLTGSAEKLQNIFDLAFRSSKSDSQNEKDRFSYLAIQKVPEFANDMVRSLRQENDMLRKRALEYRGMLIQ